MAVALDRDTLALEDRVGSYVARRDSKPQAIDRLAVLMMQTRQAVSRVKQNHNRPGDILAARVAADALAAYLQIQTQGP